MLDSIRRVETPEGVELTLPLAGPIVRSRAWMIDALFKFFGFVVFSFGASLFGKTGVGLSLIFLFSLAWLYPVIFLALRGATPGKMAVGLRVVHDNGTPIGWPAALIRGIVGFADTMPACYGVGLIATLIHPDFKRLADMAAGTVVVYARPRRARRFDADDARVVAPTPPRVPLLPVEQRAIVDFAIRAPQLTPERGDELAALATALTTTERDRPEQLRAQAAWISGRR